MPDPSSKLDGDADSFLNRYGIENFVHVELRASLK